MYLAVKRAPETVLSSAESQQDLRQLLNAVQIHNCRMHGGGKCRYGFPKPLMAETNIEVNTTGAKVQMDIHTKRDHPMINNSNHTISRVWRGNIDIQYVANPFGAAQYAAFYTSKSEPDGSTIREVASSVRRLPPDSTQARLLRSVGNAAVGARQVSHQEAVCIMSTEPYTVLSRELSLVNTLPSEQRSEVLQSRRQLATAADACTDIATSGPLSQKGKRLRYANRPTDLEHLNWYQFEQCYKHTKQQAKNAYVANISLV